MTEHHVYRCQGDDWRAEGARKVLPILVRQAKAQQPITYGEIGLETGLDPHMQLNHVLGFIGEDLQAAGQVLGFNVPPLMPLAVSKSTELPGNGLYNTFSGYLGQYVPDLEGFQNDTNAGKRARLKRLYLYLGEYPNWDRVLEELELEPSNLPLMYLDAAKALRGGSGEGPDHLRLKEYVASHPEVVGLRAGSQAGAMERPFPSGDTADVFFQRGKEWVVAEVKSHTSPEADIIRGVFQCVKYAALMKAELQVLSSTKRVRTLLILGGKMPATAMQAANTLSVAFKEGVSPES